MKGWRHFLLAFSGNCVCVQYSSVYSSCNAYSFNPIFQALNLHFSMFNAQKFTGCVVYEEQAKHGIGAREQGCRAQRLIEIMS
jgi:hypothetical protein